MALLTRLHLKPLVAELSVETCSSQEGASRAFSGQFHLPVASQTKGKLQSLSGSSHSQLSAECLRPQRWKGNALAGQHEFDSLRSCKCPRHVRCAAHPSDAQDRSTDGEDDDEGSSGKGRGREGKEEPEIEKALNLDANIPSTADKFLQKVSSNAYNMRQRLEQTLESNSYDVVEANPWGKDAEKPLYVLAQEEDKLYTMRTRRARSEVERELDILFPSQRRRNPRFLSPDRAPAPAQSHNVMSKGNTLSSRREDPSFKMHVDDVREGVLVFEDEEEAARYCSVLEGQGHQCMGIAQVPAKEVFAICQQSKALAVLFRRGNTPPAPNRLQMNLKARKHSLED